jgi:RNA polymerase sigma factor (sigma-70 family)
VGESADDSEKNFRSPFRTTCWTDVLSVHGKSQTAEESFTRLYQDYWPPLYGYVRRRGLTHEEAEEITQDFFLALIEKGRLAKVQREGGRFRSFLLTSIQNFLANVWDKKNALKRGGGARVRSLEETGIEPQIIQQASEAAADLSYDRDWALLVLKRALEAIEREFALGKKEKLFAALRPQLQGDRGGRPYPEIAAELGMSESAVKVAVHRMRHRYGEILREEIERTVGSPAEVQDELRHLLRIVGGG